LRRAPDSGEAGGDFGLELRRQLRQPGQRGLSAVKFGDDMAQGVVMSSMAKAFNWKDGSGKVACIRREIALQLGWAVVGKTPEQNAGTVKLAGNKVIEFLKLPKLPVMTQKVLRWE
jgi:hypothetical protein